MQKLEIHSFFKRFIYLFLFFYNLYFECGKFQTKDCKL
ncbi:hypothetical protein LEP1GSC172_1670 [Leptospira noguchii]|uniref:Uncharacterized protein n=2 Tax=Leptospira noguchii TaxID=28182 RepID=T0FDF8_9LEPT|nr:hypothetical protein LEP1GSC172_1670 [Leptospira noguchii]EQA71218.1 hypothetical protein LEP1GSC059_3016 [Leptospira noguchii serovar Panama str. CZ214]